MQKKKTSLTRTQKSKDLPATQGMLQLVRSELKADSRSLRSEMRASFDSVDGRFKQIDARFNEVDAQFNKIDARFSKVDARFNRVDSKLEQVLAEVSRIGFIVEEQNSRNQVVLEGLSGLFHRQERSETRLDRIEVLVHELAKQPKR